MMGSILQVKNIETLYYGLIKALRGISLDIQEGTISVVLGANGAGKTTTLKTVMGLLEDQPDKGTIEFLGKRIDRMDAEDIVNLGIAMVPEGREVFPELSVKENLQMGAYIRKDRKGIQEDLELVIRYFPILKTRSGQQAGYLSGGEQQMLAIGMSLVVKPQLLLLDEPLLGLSPMMQKTLVNAICNLKKDSGITVLMTEQFARPVLPIIDRGYVIENGMLTLSGTGKELMDNPEIKAAYFGV
jgi:branched-chain amino acid transport system ATP-binding protein